MREGDSRIDNSDIKACTYWKGLGPYEGRLNYVGSNGGWRPS